MVQEAAAGVPRRSGAAGGEHASAAISAASTPERMRLLELTIDLILRDGVIDLSLSAIARGIGSNNRMLLYYFGSKAQLLNEAAIIASHRFVRLSTLFDRLRAPGPLLERLDRAWDDIAAAENRPFLILYFQRFGMAMRDRAEWERFIGHAMHDWEDDLADVLGGEGLDAEDALLAATQIVACWRGMQTSLLAGGDAAVLRAGYRRGVRSLLASFGLVLVDDAGPAPVAERFPGRDTVETPRP